MCPRDSKPPGKLDQVIDTIARLCAGDYEVGPPGGGPPGELDKVLAGLGMLAGKLRGSTIPRDSLEQVVQLMPIPALMASASGIIEAVNPALENLLVRGRADLVGQPLLKLLPPPENVGPLIERLTRRPIREGKLFQAGSGQNVQVEMNSRPIADASGRCRAILMLLRKVETTSQLALAALTSVRPPTGPITGNVGALGDVLETLPEAVAVTDFASKFIFVNSEFEKSTGWPREQALGRTAAELGLIATEVRDRISREVIPSLTRDGEVRNLEVLWKDRQGQPMSVVMNLALLRGRTGQPQAIINVIKNVSAVRAAERRVEHLNRVLKAVRGVDQLIVKERDRARLISSACDLLVATRGYSRAWIGLLRGPGEGELLAQATAGEPACSAETGPGPLPQCARQAISTAGTVAIRDPRSGCPSCTLSREYQLDYAMVTRLEHAGRVFGVIGVAAPGDYLHDPENRAMFEEVASDLGYALYNIELDEERQQAMAALQESNERYRTLFESSPQGLVLADPETGQVQYLNRAFLQLFGYSPNEVRLIDARELHPPEHAAAIEDGLETVARGGQKLAVNVPCRRQDGSVFLADLRQVEMTIDGRPAILSFVSDATDRNRAELQLSEAQERLSLLFEFAPDAYFIHDAGGIVADVNRMAEELSGFTRRELIGHGLFELNILSPADGERASASVAAIGSGERTAPAEYVFHRKDGSTVPVEIMASPVRIRGNEYVLRIARDISDRRRMEQDLIRSSEELRQTTAQLIHRERLSALGELAASITHELNQPLNGIKLIAQVLSRYIDDYSPEQMKQDLSEVVSLVGSMSEIINHMRVFTRGYEERQKNEVSLNRVAEAAIKLVSYQLELLGVELQVDLGAEPATIMGDPVRLEQVVLNLLTNARNALEAAPGDRSKRLAVRSFRRAGEPGAQIILEVEDNGVGVPIELHEKVFQPFFTTREKGTGVGLSIASRIITEHGGKLELESRAGMGATFRVVLEAAP